MSTAESTSILNPGPVVMPPLSVGNVPSSEDSLILQSPSLQAGVPPSSSVKGGSFPASNVLKLSNLPSDLTKREATLIFSLAMDEVVDIDIVDYQLIASFKNVNTCLTAGKLLEGRHLFGEESGPIKVEFEHSSLNSPSTLAHNANSLANLRISTGQGQSLPASGQNSAIGFDNFQKRLSLGNQRSRFVFSDPFGGPGNRSGPPSASGPGAIDLSDITGKSLLLMELHNDAREYDSLVRDPWGLIGTSSIPLNSAPQTPGVNSANHAPFDWNSSQATTPNDRRRTSSSFFNSTMHLLAPQTSILTGTAPSVSQQQSSGQGTTNGSHISHGPQLGLISIPSHNTIGIQTPTSSHPSSSIPVNAQSLNKSQTPQSSTSPTSAAQSSSTTSTNATTALQVRSTQPQQPTQSLTTQLQIESQPQSATKDVPDLSLLARVPPPANPADQNPPCNTLYVGNLPPDATETELRSLFAPQKGFRRLSFRTKNLSLTNGNGSGGHNHGPMCFVEFEDVAHATRALAELYGRALPRPNVSSGKGGIRLSFSKNPLGVRGPGNSRRTSNQNITSNASSTNGNGTSNAPSLTSNQPMVNSNGVGYSYLNYQQQQQQQQQQK